MIVKAALFEDEDESRIVEGLDGHLSDVIKQVVMVDRDELMSLKIDDVNFAFGHVEDDDFLFVEHGKAVDDIFVAILP